MDLQRYRGLKSAPVKKTFQECPVLARTVDIPPAFARGGHGRNRARGPCKHRLSFQVSPSRRSSRVFFAQTGMTGIKSGGSLEKCYSATSCT
jgi:hypothetical protein